MKQCHLVHDVIPPTSLYRHRDQSKFELIYCIVETHTILMYAYNTHDEMYAYKTHDEIIRISVFYFETHFPIH